MPVILGPFETSLRGGDSPHVDRKVLHRGCCGAIHGHGVKKERSSIDHPKASRSCSHDDSIVRFTLDNHNSSSSEENHNASRRSLNKNLASRSQSSDCAQSSHGLNHYNNGRRSNSAVADRLYNSPTKATTAKLRAERTLSDGRNMHKIMSSNTYGRYKNTGSMGSLTKRPNHFNHLLMADQDSGHFSSDTEGHSSHHNQKVGFVGDLPASEMRKRSLITGASDDELLSMEEMRARARRERRDYLQQRQNSPRSLVVGPQHRRVMSPSPMPKKRYAERGRRSSDELYSEESSTTSPPLTPTPRSGSSRPHWSRDYATLPNRRAVSNGSGNNKKGSNYAFGSSVQRFNNDSKTKNLNKSSSDGVQNGADDIASALSQVYGTSASASRPVSRTSSHDTRSLKSSSSKGKSKESVQKAWMQFKEDVESALRRKPNQQGFYKNLSELMSDKMDMLNNGQVRECLHYVTQPCDIGHMTVWSLLIMG